jgi:transposase
VVDGGVYERKKVCIDVTGLHRLGIDEIALRKGHKDFAVVLIDLDTHTLVGMAPSRSHDDIKAVLLGWGTAVLSNMKNLTRRAMPFGESPMTCR